MSGHGSGGRPRALRVLMVQEMATPRDVDANVHRIRAYSPSIPAPTSQCSQNCSSPAIKSIGFTNSRSAPKMVCCLPFS
jgi:hypothetical protein